MCRFIAYLGNPILLDDVLYKPRNSLIQQSTHAREMSEPLNGDGFGIGWYAHSIDNIPALFKSMQPAWNNLNLKYLAPKIRSDCFFAHIRAASHGGVDWANCHPFHHKYYLFMHNGTIGEFGKIKRELRRSLSDNLYEWINGQTDSEHFFALYLQILAESGLHFNAKNAANILIETLDKLNFYRKKAKLTEPSFINCVLTNGKSMVALRYVSDVKLAARTLYYAAGSRYEYHGGTCHIRPAADNDMNGAVLVVSEKLTDHVAEWHEIPVNHMLLIFEDLSISEQKVKT